MTFALLVLAGVGAGLSGSIAGLASLISYPALLAVGLSPVTANVTNTVALVSTGVGSVIGSRPELAGHWRKSWRLGGVCAAGGAVGGALLLVTPSGTFARIVPWLIALGSLAILLRPRPTALGSDGRGGLLLGVGIFLIGVYGGYFGAAAGVLMLAILLLSGELLARANAMKNLVLGLANAVAAVAFVIFGPVDWSAAIPLGVGFYVGGWIGPAVVRRAPANVLRVLIALAGLGLAIWLGIDAYR